MEESSVLVLEARGDMVSKSIGVVLFQVVGEGRETVSERGKRRRKKEEKISLTHHTKK